MSGFFDDSHVTDVGLEGSTGRSVGLGELFTQNIRQQFRVDSALALDTELRTRWLDSLQKAQIAQSPESDPDRFAYAAFAQSIQGQPIDVTDLNPWEGDLTERFKGMSQANETIKRLNNPEIKSFEQILEEVARMQHEVEGKTSSMYERSGTGGFVASMLGAMVGSFTTRDPLNVVTAPIGAGRTIATRVAVDMGIAGAVTAATEYGDVAPNRAIVGLPERDSLFNVAAATLGAGVIRGGIEGVGAGVRAIRGRAEPDVAFDLNDPMLKQMFDANSTNPNVRAGARALDDAIFVEKNNPYGDGPAAQERFLAELRSVQRAMNGEPMTAVARVLPPVSFEQIKQVADFEIVKQQAPQLYVKLEAAQVKLAAVTQEIADVTSKPQLELIDAVRLIDAKLAEKLTQIKTRIDDPDLPEPVRVAADIEGQALLKSINPDKVMRAVDEAERADKFKVRSLRATRRAANKEYRAAYRAVEAEAARIRVKQNALETAQQRESSSILASQGLPFTGPLLRYDNVSALVDRINAFNDTLDESTAARFVRETLDEGDNKVEVEVWERDGGIDIGLKDPVDPNFKFVTDEGEMTIAQAMRDLQDDTDLIEAIKVCAI